MYFPLLSSQFDHRHAFSFPGLGSMKIVHISPHEKINQSLIFAYRKQINTSRRPQMDTFIITRHTAKSIFMILLKSGRNEIVNINYNYRLLVACDTQIVKEDIKEYVRVQLLCCDCGGRWDRGKVGK